MRSQLFFEDYLICDFTDEIEHAIIDIQKKLGRSSSKHPAEIREDLTELVHGCYPYYVDGEEDEEICAIRGCTYKCMNCPMRDDVEIVSYDSSQADVKASVISLIRSMKCDRGYNPDETEMQKVLDMIS